MDDPVECYSGFSDTITSPSLSNVSNGCAYNQTAHLAERAKMMQAWAESLHRA